MEFPEFNLTRAEDVKASDPMNQLKYSFVVLLYVTFRDIVKYALPLLSAYIKQKLETPIKLE